MLASIIIPCHNRLILLERAINSVLRAVGSEHVEIIIIDDGSTPPLKTELLRHQDLVLRNETSIGAAKSRNLGIEKAKGKNIYLLDSDDFFLEINFYIDNFEPGHLYYCEIDSQGYSSNYPRHIKRADFFNYIFYKNKHITQTSSIAFSSIEKHYFDETLPKHQDWDLTYSALKKNKSVLKRSGRVYFDRSDQLSLSRVVDHNKSSAWLRKLSEDNEITKNELDYIFYMIKSYDRNGLNDMDFLLQSLRYYLIRKITTRDIGVRLFRRYRPG